VNIRNYALKKIPVFRNIVLCVAFHNCRAAPHEKTAKKQLKYAFSKLAFQRKLFIVNRDLLEISIIIYNLVSKAYSDEINVYVDNFALNIYVPA
jgi:hypothetical protein